MSDRAPVRLHAGKGRIANVSRSISLGLTPPRSWERGRRSSALAWFVVSTRVVNEPQSQWSALTALSVLATLALVVAVVTLVLSFSIVSLIAFAVSAMFWYWILAGCARCGEPLARWWLVVAGS